MSAHTHSRRWQDAGAFTEGTFAGTAWTPSGLVLESPSATREYTDPFVPNVAATAYEEATWTSQWCGLGFVPAQFLAAWNADTPPGTWIEVRARLAGREATTDWHVLGRWSALDVADGGAIMRTSVTGQHDEHLSIDFDVFNISADTHLDRYQLGVSLLRTPMSTATPTITMLGAAARDPRNTTATPPSGQAAVCLDVPPFSQQVHRGRYPQWGGGGQVWCSPASVSMVLSYWGLGPDAAELAWVEDGPDPVVVHAARNCWDYDYSGAGNWPFCTAYAARYGARAWPEWLTSLADAERLVREGVPIVCSVAHAPGELTGAGYDTAGHLLVLVGFTADGDVICNDPASHRIASNDAVRVTYSREQFERAWLHHSGGACYLIVPVSHPLAQPS